MIQFDEHIFQMGWFNHQLGSNLTCQAYFIYFTKNPTPRRVNPKLATSDRARVIRRNRDPGIPTTIKTMGGFTTTIAEP